LDEILTEQAEISFKAGIREVVEWVNGHLVDGAIFADPSLWYLNKNHWQAQLKEWRINE
jgi:hypothetical protein